MFTKNICAGLVQHPSVWTVLQALTVKLLLPRGRMTWAGLLDVQLMLVTWVRWRVYQDRLMHYQLLQIEWDKGVVA